MAPDDFRELLRRIRARDATAAAELVAHYEPEIRRLVRLHLTDPRLRRVLDSLDVCQSVLADFFVRVVAGQFELEDPAELLRLLAVMARNKVLNRARYQRAECRDIRRLVEGERLLRTVPDPGCRPDSVVAAQEMLQTVLARLTPEERQIVDRRGAGHTWEEIANCLGGTAESLRKRLTRALDRATTNHGTEEASRDRLPRPGPEQQ